LTDVAEQNRRFNAEIETRQRENLPMAVKDERLLAALENGLPDCSGIALGLDRVLMVLAGSTAIADVLSFEFCYA
jgi:lysyl-tRNA synthetase class 2